MTLQLNYVFIIFRQLASVIYMRLKGCSCLYTTTSFSSCFFQKMKLYKIVKKIILVGVGHFSRQEIKGLHLQLKHLNLANEKNT